MSELSEKIKYYRKLKNLSQDDLAKSLNVSRVTITRYENGTREPSIEVIERIAIALGIRTIDLFGDSIKESINTLQSYMSEEGEINQDTEKSLEEFVLKFMEAPQISIQEVLKSFYSDINKDSYIAFSDYLRKTFPEIGLLPKDSKELYKEVTKYTEFYLNKIKAEYKNQSDN